MVGFICKQPETTLTSIVIASLMLLKRLKVCVRFRRMHICKYWQRFNHSESCII